MATRSCSESPAHVGIIMDGNGRWASARGLPRTEGHREGLETAKRIVTAAGDLGIKVLSLYTFSTENWKRTKEEVGFLMGLIRRHLTAELDYYRQNRVRVVHSGDPDGLPQDVVAEIRNVEADTASFDRLTVNLAINYGGRDEIVRAARRAVLEGAERLFRALDVPVPRDLVATLERARQIQAGPPAATPTVPAAGGPSRGARQQRPARSRR